MEESPLPVISLEDTLNSAYKKDPIEQSNIDRFKKELLLFLDRVKENLNESEEHHKRPFVDFLSNTWYAPEYYINTSDKVDLVIHNGNKTQSPIGVIIETKSPVNKSEMVSKNNINVKSMHQLLLYFLRETITKNSFQIKHLIITNYIEWFIFDARDFYQILLKEKKLVNTYKDYSNGLFGNDTKLFYSLIATPFIEQNKENISFTHINLDDYSKIIKSTDKAHDIKLIPLYKVLSPQHLLKIPFSNDNNSLNNNFYLELLYIIGLTEKDENGKIILDRYENGKYQSASLLENAIFQLSDEYAHEDILFDVSLELNLTWINRILFLKLLEAQLLKYHNGNKDFSFLNSNTIKTFNELNTLFFNVLAVEPKNRADKVKDKFKNIPYLNSSLFEKTENESKILISNLENEEMDVFISTVLRDENGNKRKGKIKILDYIFEFLDAFDFSSDETVQIKVKNKTLINASVLGLIFEKINGYKEGSFYTPGFITSFICSETIKNAVVERFNEIKNWKAKNIIDIYNKIDTVDIYEANSIFNKIKILDPAVGSGHFLVSALNEIIATKSYLGILFDCEGKKIKDYKIFVENDELVIVEKDNGKSFDYDFKNDDKQRIQEAIFNEKRRIIENCLFGVDINPNSVKICRLRLWIELLKHSYYTKESKYKELETLPNIDINIKPGNSLISRFNLDDNITSNSAQYTIQKYKDAVQNYKSSNNKTDNKKLLDIIKSIKTNFSDNIKKQNNLFREKQNLEKKLSSLGSGGIEFDFVTEKELEEKQKKIEKIEKEILAKQIEIDAYLHGEMYDNAFEWRLEFPEVLDTDGKFIGFDAVIGNPPYLREGRISKTLFENHKSSPYYQGKMDIWYLFACMGIDLLRNNGILSFIATNNWTTAAGASKLRNVVIEKTKILELIDFTSFMVFENASIQTMIMSFQKKADIDNYKIDYRKLSGIVTLSDALDLLDKKKNNNALYLSPTITKNNFIDKFITFSPNNIILDKISEKGQFLNENEVANGIHPHYDFINKKLSLLHKLKIGEGIFGLSKAEKENLNLSKEELKLVRPYYTSEQIYRYYSSQKNKLFIIYTTSDFKKPNSMDNYPNLKKHLDKYKKVITSDNKPYGLHRSRDERFFKGEKILANRKCVGKPSFSYSDFTCYVPASFYVIKTDRFNNKYLTGLLNSKLIAFWLKNKGKMQGNNFQLDKEPLIQIPIFKPTEAQQKPIISLIDKILEAKKEKQDCDTDTLEQKIDSLIYKLYGLSDDDIAAIEETT